VKFLQLKQEKFLKGCLEYRRLSEKYIKGEITLEDLGREVRKNLPSNKSR